MKIRQVGLEYLDEIRNITEKTFIETFGKENTEEDIESYIKENVSREKVRQELMNPASLFYIVERNDRIVAYMKLNLEGAQTEEGYSNSLEIQRIYVL
ncbi:MAG: GNAT family N-acetyltransferase, partial [Alkalibacterium sp.]